MKKPRVKPLGLKSEETEPVYVYTEVTPEAGDNPATEGWYELNNEEYVLTEDTEVDEEKTYYTRSVQQ